MNSIERSELLEWLAAPVDPLRPIAVIEQNVNRPSGFNVTAASEIIT
jgi:hypothetical protein